MISKWLNYYFEKWWRPLYVYICTLMLCFALEYLRLANSQPDIFSKVIILVYFVSFLGIFIALIRHIFTKDYTNALWVGFSILMALVALYILAFVIMVATFSTTT